MDFILRFVWAEEKKYFFEELKTMKIAKATTTTVENFSQRWSGWEVNANNNKNIKIENIVKRWKKNKMKNSAFS